MRKLRLGHRARLVAAGASFAVAGLLGLSAAPAALAENSDAEPTRFAVSGAVLDWAINDEVGGGGFAPGTCNFLAAGTAPGQTSSTQWAESMFSARVGDVEILRPDRNGALVQATWADRCKDASGAPLSARNTAQSSKNLVRLSAGEGWVDTETGAASVSWTGSFTVVFYNGLTRWTATDPTLIVGADGAGRLTAVVSGYEADQDAAMGDDEPAEWTPMPSRRVALATFGGSGGSAVSAAEAGVSAQPHYLAVRNDEPDQHRSGAHWGSFPQELLDQIRPTGQVSYWMSTQGTRDPAKPAKPFSATWDLGDPVDDGSAPEPEPTPTEAPTPTPSPSPDTPAPPAPTPTPDDGDGDDGEEADRAFTVDDAELRWGLNRESSGGAFFGTCNFLSAGRSGDAGGSKVWTKSDGLWQATDRDVRVEKPSADGEFSTVSWDERCNDRTGTKVEAADPLHTTEMRVAMTGGAGSVDPVAGTAKIRWSGSFTVVYYGGLTYWTATDPVLTVRPDGRATLTATASGYGADREDTSAWGPLDPRTITLATLTDVDVSRTTGFTVVPDYLGVKAATTSADAAQVPRTAANAGYWGAFPGDFLAFQRETGQGSFWYSSGGARDAAKPATRLVVAYDANLPSDDLDDDQGDDEPRTDDDDDDEDDDKDGDAPDNRVRERPRTPARPAPAPAVGAAPLAAGPVHPVSPMSVTVAAAVPEPSVRSAHARPVGRAADEPGLMLAGAVAFASAGVLVLPRRGRMRP